MESEDHFIKQLKIDTKLVVHFFGVFSRLEYALKRAGFATANRNGVVSAQWNEFLALLEPQFQPTRTGELQAAVDYLNQHPPLKQILVNNRLEWRKIDRIQNEELLSWLVKLVRAVRNNLFHGGKFPMQPVDEPARNTLLLSHSLIILYECINLSAICSPKVHAYFHDDIE